MDPSLVRFGDLPDEEVRPGVTRRAFSTGKLTWIRYTYAPGSVFPSHAHPQEQVTLVHEGTIEFTAGGRTLLLGPGDAAVIPADLPHSARATGEVPVVTDNVMVPKREEEIRVLE